MKRVLVASVFAIAAVALVVPAYAGEGAQVLDHKVKDIDGKDVDLSKYKGNVVLIVNVASKCGLTPQYEQLVELDKKYRDQGLRILGFPANEFLKQEPGTNAEIKEFCTSKFDVEFDMFSKIVVKGDGIHPLYQELTSEKDNPDYSGEIAWNFTKFLVDREGNVVKRIEPRTKPDDPEVVTAIEQELEKKSS